MALHDIVHVLFVLLLNFWHAISDDKKISQYNVQRTLFITTFVITSIQPAQKSADRILFIESPMLFFRKSYVLVICKNSLAEAILTNAQSV